MYYKIQFNNILRNDNKRKDKKHDQKMAGKLFDLSDFDLSGTIDAEELAVMIELLAIGQLTRKKINSTPK